MWLDYQCSLIDDDDNGGNAGGVSQLIKLSLEE